MAISDNIGTMKTAFIAAHSYLSSTDVDRLCNKATGIYLDLVYPFDNSIVAIPETRPRAVQWLNDCMEEILERNGTNAVSYGENGLSIVFDNSMMSNGLRARLITIGSSFDPPVTEEV